MTQPIFKTSRTGKFGPYTYDHTYMLDVERRAKRVEKAAGEEKERSKQMRLKWTK